MIKLNNPTKTEMKAALHNLGIETIEEPYVIEAEQYGKEVMVPSIYPDDPEAHVMPIYQFCNGAPALVGIVDHGGEIRNIRVGGAVKTLPNIYSAVIGTAGAYIPVIDMGLQIMENSRDVELSVGYMVTPDGNETREWAIERETVGGSTTIKIHEIPPPTDA